MSNLGDHSGFFDRIWANAQAAAGRLRVKSALNPMLWLCAIVPIPSFVLAYIARDVQPLSDIATYAGAAPICAAILGFFWFMIRAPEKLQSEDYQIRHEALALIKEKGSSIEVSPSSLDLITNPVLPALPKPGAK